MRDAYGKLAGPVKPMWFVCFVAGWLTLPAQGGLEEPPWLKKPSRVTIQASVEPPRAPAGRPVVLILDVTPVAGVHVYAPGNVGYAPPEVRLDLPRGVRRAGEPTFPPAQPLVFGELKEVVQVYRAGFRIRQPLTIDPAVARRPAQTARLAGTVAYQACTARVCFPPQVEPFEATLRLR